MSNNQTTATLPAETIAQLAVAGIKVFDVNDIPHALLPPGYKLESLEETLPDPLRIREHIIVRDAVSLIDYYQLFGGVDISLIFANEDASEITAKLDYHSTNGPSHCTHTCTLKLAHSDEWKVWHSNNGKMMPQRVFAELIEDNIKDIMEPSGAELLEVAKTLQATKKLNFRSGQELHNGQVQLTYNEEIKGEAGPSGQLQIPRVIKLALRVYRGEDPYSAAARFRYRITDEGQLMFSYHIDNVAMIKEDAFKTIVDKIKANCKGQGFIRT